MSKLLEKEVTFKLKFECEVKSDEFKKLYLKHQEEFPKDTISDMLSKILYWTYMGTINGKEPNGPYGKFAVNTTGNEHNLNVKKPKDSFNGITVLGLKQIIK